MLVRRSSHQLACLALIAFALPMNAKAGRAAAPTSAPNLSPVPAAAAMEVDTQDAAAIKKLLTDQAADWNRGDLQAFAQGYKHAPDILFMGGSSIRRGYEGMLARYKENYPTRERMGQLTFTELEVQPLGPGFATTTGHFHLERSAAGGGNADGVFLLVLEQTRRDGWKIVRDDTTSLPVKTK